MATERWNIERGERLARRLLDRVVERNDDDVLCLWRDTDWERAVGETLDEEASEFVDGDAFRCLVAWATADCPDYELVEFSLVKLVAGAIQAAVDYGF